MVNSVEAHKKFVIMDLGYQDTVEKDNNRGFLGHYSETPL